MRRSNLLVYSSIFLSSTLAALPSGTQVVQGHVEIAPGGESLRILSGDKAIIHWDAFSIGVRERVHFEQMSSSSSVLNRVTGGQMSEILGALSSNGHLFLLNPNGILIGPSGHIETAGFIGSTFDVLDADFLKDQALLFSGSSEKSIKNLGKIVCPQGDVRLFAACIVNEGAIQTPQGHTTIAIGGDILLQKDGTANIFVRPGGSDQAKEGAALDHKGTIEALTVELLAGKTPYQIAVRSSGEIDALHAAEVGGEIYLVAFDGMAEVNGGRLSAAHPDGAGGTVHVLGDTVSIVNQAQIDASGNWGGGAVLIGGDYQGSNPAIKNGKISYVSQDSTITADAGMGGDGGRVIVWGEEASYFYGNIAARGGAMRGDGGFVEVSGKYLDYQGFADRRAPQGKPGTLLLDPINITIGGVQTANVVNPPPNGSYTFTGCAPTPAVINTVTLVGNLAAGNVTINTSAAVAGPCMPDEGTITVSTGFMWPDATTLTLISDAGIAINASIISTSAMFFTAMDFTANSSGTAPGTFTGISVNAPLTSTGGNLFLSGKAGLGGSGTGISVSSTITSTTGQITFQNSQGGTAGFFNEGVRVTGTVVAPVIVGVNLLGGTSPGSSNAGFRVNGGTVGSSMTTAAISISAIANGIGGEGILVDAGGNLFVNNTGVMTLIGQGSLLSTSSAAGIRILSGAGTISGGDTATFTWIGTGGGIFATAGGNNSGIFIDGGTISAGAAGMSANMNFTGTGGHGTSGGNHGVRFELGTTFTLSGTGTVNLSGTGGSGGASRGVSVGSLVTAANGTIDFSNSTGGTELSSNSGAVITSTGIVDAAAIQGSNITGGPATGTDNNGFLVSGGVLGSLMNTGTISILASGSGATGNGLLINNSGVIQANSVGSIFLTGFGSTTFSPGSSCAGVQIGVFGGTITAGDNSSIILTGTGGGAGAGTGNFGIFLAGGSILSGGAGTSTVTLNGTGGRGSTGGNDGIRIQSPAAVTLANLGSITLSGNGGTATPLGPGNNGVFLGSSLSAPLGSVVFQNSSGGISGMNNHGVIIQAPGSINAETIDATFNIVGGNSSGNSNFGFYVNGGTVGSNVNTNTLSITATGGGTGSSEDGIVITSNGIIRVNDTGTLTLNGFGSPTSVNLCRGIRTVFGGGATISGGNAATLILNGTGGGSGAGGVHSGIHHNTGTIQAGTGALSTATITMTGFGGSGATGSNRGVFISGGAVNLLGTGAVTLSGTGSSGSSSSGVGILSSVTALNGSIIFNSCIGGASDGSHGVQIGAAGVVNAPTITATNMIFGGGGSSSDGFNIISGGVVGSATTTALTIEATALGTGSGNDGISIGGTVQIGPMGSLDLTGAGSVLGVDNNVGILIAGGSVLAGNSGSITYNGTGGGSGIGTGNHGVSQTGGLTSAGLNNMSTASLNIGGIGGNGTGGFNHGVSLTGGTIRLFGINPLSFNNCFGGSGGSSIGLYLASSTIQADSSVLMTSCTGGTSGDNNIGIQVDAGAVITSPSITGLMISGGSSVGNGNVGFYLNGGTVGSIATTTFLDVTATGDGINGQGILIDNNGLFQSAGTLNLTGTGSLAAAADSGCIGLEIGLNGGSIVGDDATAMVLTGTGGGGGIGSGNYGFFMQSGSILAGVDAMSTAMVQIQGTGGMGLGGSNHGVYMTGGFCLVNSSGILEIALGAGGAGGSSAGAWVENSLSNPFGTVGFSNCNGGNAGNNNPGVVIASGGSASAIGIIGAGTGGSGDSSYGFAVINGGVLGPAIGSISIVGAATGAGVDEAGIKIDAGTVQSTGMGMIALQGFGGPGTAPGCPGIHVTNGSVVTSVDGIIGLTGTGGAGSGPVTVEGGSAISSSGTGQIVFNRLGGGFFPIGLGSCSISGASGAGPIDFNWDVQLLANTVQIFGGGTRAVRFGRTVNGGFDLTITSYTATFFDVVGGVDPLATLTVNATVDHIGINPGEAGFPLTATTTGNMTFNGPIFTLGGPVMGGVGPNGGDILLTSSGGSISVNDIQTSGTSSLTGGNAGAITMQPGAGSSFSPILGTVPDGTITFTGTAVLALGGLGAMPGTDGALNLAPAGRTSPMSIATIIGLNDLLLKSGSLTMGTNESMTVLGNLTIDPGPVVVSSIVALDQLTIVGTSIALNPQPSAQYLSSDGSFYTSPDAHLLSRLPPSFTPGVTPPGARTGTVGIADRAFFLSALTFGGTVLNFDLHLVNPDFLASLIFEEVVATTQLGRVFRTWRNQDSRFFPYYTLCMDPEDRTRCDDPYFRPFIFESDIMTDAGRVTLYGVEQ